MPSRCTVEDAEKIEGDIRSVRVGNLRITPAVIIQHTCGIGYTDLGKIMLSSGH